MPQCARVPLLAVLFATFFFTPIAPVLHAQTNASNLELKKGFFNPLRYTYQGSDLQNVYNFTGLKFQPHFEDLLGQDPAALQEAKKAFVFNGVALAGSTIMFVGAVQLVSSSSDNSGLEMVLVGAVVTIVSSVMGNKRLKNGVRLFNENQQRTSQATPGNTVHFTVGSRYLASRPALTLRLHIQ